MLRPRQEYEQRLLSPNKGEPIRYSQCSPRWKALLAAGTSSVWLQGCETWGRVDQGNISPSGLKGSLMVQNQRGVTAPCLPWVKVRLSRCLIGFDSLRTGSHSARGETQGRGTAWAGVHGQAHGKGGCSNTVMASTEERGRV